MFCLILSLTFLSRTKKRNRNRSRRNRLLGDQNLQRRMLRQTLVRLALSILTIRYVQPLVVLQALTSGQRVTSGMKILCQVVSIQPYQLIVSLPNQLLGHVPITQVSTQLTSILDAADAASEDSADEAEDDNVDDLVSALDLSRLFEIGQYLRSVVTAVRPLGSTEGRSPGHARDEVEKASRRVELSLIPEQVNAGLTKDDLRPGSVSAD